jgi:hypothetical protein
MRHGFVVIRRRNKGNALLPLYQAIPAAMTDLSVSRI